MIKKFAILSKFYFGKQLKQFSQNKLSFAEAISVTRILFIQQSEGSEGLIIADKS